MSNHPPTFVNERLLSTTSSKVRGSKVSFMHLADVKIAILLDCDVFTKSFLRDFLIRDTL